MYLSYVHINVLKTSFQMINEEREIGFINDDLLNDR